MDLAEINRYLTTGNVPYVCISRQYFADDLNIIREIYIGKNNLVKLEFNTWGYDEGGLAIEFSYADETQIITSLENFLHHPIENWENFNKTGDYPAERNLAKTGGFLDYIKNKTLIFPKNWQTVSIKNTYWQQFFALDYFTSNT